MDIIVYSVEEAREWFMTHHSGMVTCQLKNGEQKKVNCFPDAKDFFKTAKPPSD